MPRYYEPFKFKVKFEPRDLWIGLYWKWSPISDYEDYYDYNELKLFLCIVPTFPLIFTFAWR